MNIFNDDGSLKSNNEIEQINFINTLKKHPHLLEHIIGKKSVETNSDDPYWDSHTWTKRDR